MRSESWTVLAACWNGRQLPVDTRKNLTGRWLSTLSSFAIPVSQASLTLPKLFLFESALWKFNISEQRSRKNSALNLVSWWKVPSPRSSPARFSRTVAYGFPKTHALPAPTLGCAWDGRIWSRALSYEFVEMNLVGLMSLTTKNPPASPNLNRRRA